MMRRAVKIVAMAFLVFFDGFLEVASERAVFARPDFDLAPDGDPEEAGAASNRAR